MIISVSPFTLYALDPIVRFDHLTIEHNLSHNEVNTIFQDNRGYMWFGTKNGLNRYNRAEKTFSRYYHNPEDSRSLSDSEILSIYENIRQSDICARFEGEEFVVFLPDSDEVQAQVLADKIRKAIADTPFQGNDFEQSITISVGVVAGMMPLEKLIKHADIAMYQAKRNGKNRIHCLQIDKHNDMRDI